MCCFSQNSLQRPIQTSLNEQSVNLPEGHCHISLNPKVMWSQEASNKIWEGDGSPENQLELFWLQVTKSIQAL